MLEDSTRASKFSIRSRTNGSLSIAAAAQSVQSDGFVKDLVNLFDAKVVDSTIKQEGK